MRKAFNNFKILKDDKQFFGISLSYNVFTNPEAVGEFFGRIASGFQSATQ